MFPGKNIVTIGGGTGLSNLLESLKTHTDSISAIVTTTDDGGSSGKIRKDFNIPSPGDIRKCLIALSNLPDEYKYTLNYRFKSDSALYNHNLGNLLLTALNEQEVSFSDAVEKAGLLLNIQGHVIPISDNPEATLNARTISNKVLSGESIIGKNTEQIIDIWVTPTNITLNPKVIETIEKCDAVIIGPGSLYTSLIPNFLVPGITECINASKKPIIFISNLINENETKDFSIQDHILTFQKHTQINLSHIICNSNNNSFPELLFTSHLGEKDKLYGIPVICTDLTSTKSSSKHDGEKLTEVIIKFLINN